ncbi:MAG: hypothetical protein KAJ03_10830 [Gammaproteobacteria bacterium]|nr:hypothetical protein [Gammaproteobacteria bacterium]
MASIKTMAGGGSANIDEVVKIILFIVVLFISLFLLLPIIIKLFIKIAVGNTADIFDDLVPDWFKLPDFSVGDRAKDPMEDALATHAERLRVGASSTIIESGTVYQESIVPNLGLSYGQTSVITDPLTKETFFRSVPPPTVHEPIARITMPVENAMQEFLRLYAEGKRAGTSVADIQYNKDLQQFLAQEAGL